MGDIVLNVLTGELLDLGVVIPVGPPVIVVGISRMGSLSRHFIFLVIVPVWQPVVVVVKELAQMFVLSTMRFNIAYNSSL